MHSLLQDLRYALRLLAKSPGFTAVAVVTLALGIGANTAIFSLINAVLLKPLPGLEDPERVVSIGRTYKGAGFDNSSYPNYRDLRDQNTVFSDVAAEHQLPISLMQGGRSERLVGSVVTANYFRTLGVGFAFGRGFLDNEDVNGNAAPVIVISQGLWRQRFGGDPKVVGSTVAVDGHPMTVVGVTGRGFIGSDPTSAVDVWVPMGAARLVLPRWIDLDEHMRQRGWSWIKLFARLKPGVSVEQSAAEVSTIEARLRSAYPETDDHEGWILVRGVGLEPAERTDVTRLTGILFGVVALLLLLACANVSNLLLARATARKREITVRLALGARRGRIVRQLLTESLLLAALGGLAGLAMSFWAAAALSRFFADFSRFSLVLDLSPEWRVFGFTFAISAVTGIAFGIAPALQSARSGLAPALKEAAALAPRRSRLRALLVVTQLALSLVLLAGAGLLLRTLWNFNQIRPGVDTRHLALMTIEPTLTRNYDDDLHLRLFHQRLLERVQALSGVEAATLARVAPVSSHGWGINARFPGKPSDDRFGVQYNSVAPNYFETVGIPVIRGRGFGLQDAPGSPGAMVINETMARNLWPGEDPIGKQLLMADETVPRQVVGVVPDIKYRSLLEKPRGFAYLSMWQPYPMPDAPTVIHVRTRLPLGETAARVQRELQMLDPNLPLFEIKNISEQIAGSYWRQRMTGLLISIFAALALSLGVAGMYSVMAYAVAERTHEIGIRMALGARVLDVLRLILSRGVVMIACGVIAGMAGALAATRLLKTLLYGVGASDPVTLIAAAAVLVTAALLASYVPARRATKVDPMVALRYE